MRKVAPGVYSRKVRDRVRILADAVCGMHYDAAMERAQELNAHLERGKAILEEFQSAAKRGRWNSGRAGK